MTMAEKSIIQRIDMMNINPEFRMKGYHNSIWFMIRILMLCEESNAVD